MEVINSNIFGVEGDLTNLKQCKQWKRIQIFAGAKSGGEVPGCCWAWRECAFPKGNLWPLCSNWVPNEPYVVKSSNVSKEARHSNILWKRLSFKRGQTIWDLKTKQKNPVPDKQNISVAHIQPWGWQFCHDLGKWKSWPRVSRCSLNNISGHRQAPTHSNSSPHCHLAAAWWC